MNKNYLLIIFFFINIFLFSKKPPKIPDEDIIFVKANLGYDLYIKKIPGVESILLTESQKDTGLKKTNYGLRTLTFQESNGNEIRILNNKVLHTKYDAFFLVDSTVEQHPKLGDAFHFFLPPKVLYGYAWTANGEIEVKPGVEINLRIFEKKYADYGGDFIDQWIILKSSINENDFNSGTIESMTEISKTSGGNIKIKSKDESLKDVFDTFIPDNFPAGNDADIVFIIDVTYSMKGDIPVFQKEYPLIKEKLLSKIKNPRIALIFYRDYGDDFLTKVYDFTDDLKQIDYLITRINVDGGGDIPEAMYEAIVELKI